MNLFSAETLNRIYLLELIVHEFYLPNTEIVYKPEEQLLRCHRNATDIIKVENVDDIRNNTQYYVCLMAILDNADYPNTISKYSFKIHQTF